MLPQLVDEVTIKDWDASLKNPPPCYLYDFDAMGVSLDQFKNLIVGRKALLFEKEFQSNIRLKKCPWCEFKVKEPIFHFLKANAGHIFSCHLYTHKKKNVLSPQIKKFQEELYTFRLQLVRQGWHENMLFLVEHECQICLLPNVRGREGMCSLPTSTRNRPRSLKSLNYPIKQFTKHKKRIYEWSCLGVIVLR